MKNKEKYDLKHLNIVKGGSVPDGTGIYTVYIDKQDGNKDVICTLKRIGKLRSARALCDWLEQEYKEPPILDEKEKEFLQYLYDHIRPKIETIRKSNSASNKDDEWIRLGTYEYGILLPTFKAGEMYKGMKPFKEYTPEDLGLKVKK